MINLTCLLPKDLTKRQRFKESWEREYAKSKAFAKLFGINPDMDRSKLKPGCLFYEGKELSKKEVLDIMKKNSIPLRLLILLIGKFPISYYSWYRFRRIRNGKTKFQLCWEGEVF